MQTPPRYSYEAINTLTLLDVNKRHSILLIEGAIVWNYVGALEVVAVFVFVPVVCGRQQALR